MRPGRATLTPRRAAASASTRRERGRDAPRSAIDGIARTGLVHEGELVTLTPLADALGDEQRPGQRTRFNAEGVTLDPAQVVTIQLVRSATPVIRGSQQGPHRSATAGHS